MSAQPTPTLTHLSSTFERDMDTFFDLESLSPDSTRPQSKMAQRPSMAGSSSSSFVSRPQPMSGPSHQYDAYRQQTGLPAGGLASTFAVNQATGMQYNPSSSGFVMPVETLNFPLPSNDNFDFNTTPSYDMNDMDFDADSPAESLPAMFYPSKNQFVNPSAIGGESSSSYTPQVQRMYPGMHSQQAAQAKKQQELARQQQQQQQRALEGQHALPAQKPTKNDPVTDERISRLLQQMRHNSAVGQDDESVDMSSSLPQMAKMKKEEEEMDEDERLLASEEGKKLSSKERRQLRNKVSARAFRSRRKEYIGQLEGEVAAKNQEATDLRVQNRQLMEENARLTDLTRMLLSSPAFSGFLNELSANGGSVPSALQKTAAPQQAASQQPPMRKDINPHQVARQLQNHQQVGMVMVPEPTVDISALDLNTPPNGWNSGIDMNSFQVFAVTELPEGPTIDLGVLSGKSSTSTEIKSVASKDIPVLSSIPPQPKERVEEINVDPEIKLDESLSLFETSPVKSIPSPQSFTPLTVQKPQQFGLVTSDSTTTTATAKLEDLCAELDECCARLERFTSHL